MVQRRSGAFSKQAWWSSPWQSRLDTVAHVVKVKQHVECRLANVVHRLEVAQVVKLRHGLLGTLAPSLENLHEPRVLLDIESTVLDDLQPSGVCAEGLYQVMHPYEGRRRTSTPGGALRDLMSPLYCRKPRVGVSPTDTRFRTIDLRKVRELNINPTSEAHLEKMPTLTSHQSLNH